LSDAEVSQLYLFSSTESLPTANAGTDIQACGADSFQLIGSGFGLPNWTPAAGLTRTTILNPKGKVAIPTSYILTNTFGSCIARDTVLVQPVLVSAIVGSDTSICLVDSTQLNAMGTGSLSWLPHASLSNNAISNPFAKPTQTTQYILRANTGICNAYDTILVTVVQVSANAGSDKNICPGDSVTLNGTAQGTFFWHTQNGLSDSLILNPKAKPLVPTYFKLTANNGSCAVTDSVFVNVVDLQADAGPDLFSCKRQSVVISGSGNGTQFSWLPIKNILNNLTPTPTVNPDTTTTYILTVSNSTCLRRDTMTVFVNPLDARIHTKDTVFCLGDTIQLWATTNSPTFTWFPNTNIWQATTLTPKVMPQTTMKYYIGASDGICAVGDSIQLTLSSISLLVSSDTTLCEGDTISLLAQSAGASFSWLPSLGLSDPNAANPNAFPLNSTNYLVQAKKGNCVANANVNVLVDKIPAVNAGPDQHYCFGESATLLGSVESGSDFIWTPAIDLSDVKLLQPTAMGSVGRQYILTASRGKCTNSDTVWAEPNPKVTADFNFTPNNANYPALVQFTSLASNADFYFWDFDDLGAQSMLENPSHAYLSARKYEVWLKVSDSLGCADSISKTVNVVEEAHLKMPNAFTPNGDATNDLFEPAYTNGSFEFVRYEIYNRWGELLYTTQFPGGKWWDGSYKNAPCADGVYVYILFARDFAGEEYHLNGNFTLLR
jgi:gliding motility-associated-like protein